MIRLYRILLLFYPERFRRRYGREMEEAFRSLHERVGRERGAPGLVVL